MTITPERLRDIVSTLVVAAEHRADDLDELCNEAREWLASFSFSPSDVEKAR